MSRAGRIDWFRRNRLVPVPVADTLAELNAMIDRWNEVDDAPRVRTRPARRRSGRPSKVPGGVRDVD
ncbi:hypothetical protein [Streptomyces sp. NPDC006463]|uniref:hypothetical protein n=1 Tax=Streptomyces sp. NPDC006463 TaxID=3364746 RepID=UPI0036BAF940